MFILPPGALRARLLALLPALCLALHGPVLAAGDGAPQGTPLAGFMADFDCEDAFDLVAMMVVFRCAAYAEPAAGPARVAAALARLREVDLREADRHATTRVAFCPLAGATGMVPAPDTLYLDDGLLGLSTDGLAEIMAHEFEHVAQFERLGARGFKCAYVEAMTACGGCQDRRHPLEASAYARQDEARERLQRSTDSPAPEIPDAETGNIP